MWLQRYNKVFTWQLFNPTFFYVYYICEARTSSAKVAITGHTTK